MICLSKSEGCAGLARQRHRSDHRYCSRMIDWPVLGRQLACAEAGASCVAVRRQSDPPGRSPSGDKVRGTDPRRPPLHRPRPSRDGCAEPTGHEGWDRRATALGGRATVAANSLRQALVRRSATARRRRSHGRWPSISLLPRSPEFRSAGSNGRVGHAERLADRVRCRGPFGAAPAAQQARQAGIAPPPIARHARTGSARRPARPDSHRPSTRPSRH